MKRLTNKEAAEKFRTAYEAAKKSGEVKPNVKFEARLKLVDYEDLGKSPEELAKILQEFQDLEDAKRDGRLIVLPKSTSVRADRLRELAEYVDSCDDEGTEEDEDATMENVVWAALHMDPINPLIVTETIPMHLIRNDVYDQRGDRLYIAKPLYRVACDKCFDEMGSSLFALSAKDFLHSGALDSEAYEGGKNFLNAFNSMSKKFYSGQNGKADMSDEILKQYMETLRTVGKMMSREA